MGLSQLKPEDAHIRNDSEGTGESKIPTKGRECSNCSVKKSSCWAYSHISPPGWRCHTCRVYEYNHNILRPAHLYQRTKRSDRVCGNCGLMGAYNRHRSKLTDQLNVWICHACYVFESTHQKPRPAHLFPWNRPNINESLSPSLADRPHYQSPENIPILPICNGSPTPSLSTPPKLNIVAQYSTTHKPLCHCVECLLSPSSSSSSQKLPHSTVSLLMLPSPHQSNGSTRCDQSSNPSTDRPSAPSTDVAVYGYSLASTSSSGGESTLSNGICYPHKRHSLSSSEYRWGTEACVMHSTTPTSQSCPMVMSRDRHGSQYNAYNEYHAFFTNENAHMMPSVIRS